MSAFQRALLTASEQVLLAAPDAALSRWGLTTKYAVMAALAISGASAMAWSNSQDRGPLPEPQARRWGENVGGAVGRMVGMGVGTNSSNPAGRAAGAAVVGIAEDIGRWAGGRAASKPYETGPADATKAADRIPTADRDHLDTLALRAIFAADDLVKVAPDSRDRRALGDALYRAQRNFEVAYRGASERGIEVWPWLSLRDAIAQAHRDTDGVNAQRLADLGQAPAQRLNRPGGPGFDRQATTVNPIDQLRAQARGAQAQGDSAPRDAVFRP